VTFPVDRVYYSMDDSMPLPSPDFVHVDQSPPYSVSANKQSRFVLASIPKRKPPSFVDNAGRFLQSNLVAPLQSNLVNPISSVLPKLPLSPLSSHSLPAIQARPDQVFDGQIELGDDDTLESERGEEGEVDDSVDRNRRLRLVEVRQGQPTSEQALRRRQWEIIPLRRSKAHTGRI
jgi:hypothetical protein